MKELFRNSKNLPLEGKVKLMEKVISQMSLKLRKTTTAIITPQIIMAHELSEEVKGDIFKCALFKGGLGKAIILFDKKPKSEVFVQFNVLSGGAGSAKNFYFTKIKNEVDLDILIEDGTFINVSVFSTDNEYKVTEVWVSMLWTPDISKAKVKQHLIEKLVENSDEGI